MGCLNMEWHLQKTMLTREHASTFEHKSTQTLSTRPVIWTIFVAQTEAKRHMGTA